MGRNPQSAQIVVATHNPRIDLLHRQLDSIRAQTVEDWTCLIFDDGSGSQPDFGSLTDQDPRFRVLPPAPRKGAYGAFELLLSEAQDVAPIFLCDQDDYWHPEKLERMLATPVPAFSAMRVVRLDGTLVRDRFVTPPQHMTAASLLLMNVVSGAALKITPEVRAAALPFPAPQYRGWHDQWLAAVALRIGTLEYVDAALVDYTRHAHQVTGDGLRTLRLRSVTAFAARPQLWSRVRWLRAAAQQLQSLPGPTDPDLQAIASGRIAEALARHQVPRRRATLLRLGALGGARRTHV